ncbi:uncharacterized protein LOC122859593 isoform X2 [Aphidius gifuensis]|uniref:uncharacterized protein LOC122859593 isoform X2 n=1 Tax=Aphidius gifuensis TaxID=684658 RepID=UPI001CDC4A17|nr:uncharacterized protein LOC122859593 isoform X2 [Aphidius gifuensis]XP_044019219.1 uncharacterized protein LOC122859593 isoform X2 [Aphidius gifuensis]
MKMRLRIFLMRAKKGRGTIHIHPLNSRGYPHGKGLRSHDHLFQHVDSMMFGVKGRSALLDVPEFNMINGMPPDWMHAVLLGICRQFSKIWFKSQRHTKGCFKQFITTIDDIVKSYQPTLDETRVPEQIYDAKKLKAHELALWLLNYSLVTMKDIFPNKFVRHWSLLVDGVSILLKESIQKNEIDYSEKCLLDFVRGVERSYGKEQVSYNVHLLTHLAQSVRDLGPLWAHSAFIFENFNQQIKKSVKSSNGVAKQICDGFRLKYAIENMKLECQENLTHEINACLADMLKIKQKPKASLDLGEVKLTGQPVIQKLKPNDFLACQRSNLDVEPNIPVQYFSQTYIISTIL